MRLSWRNWGVSGMAWLAIVALGGMAIAGVAVGSSEPFAWLSPKGAVEGKTLDSGEPFEMTLHLEADAEQSYDLAVTYDGDGVGSCQADAAVLETNPQGKAVFECDFATVENTGTEDLAGTVMFTVTQEGADVAEVVAALSVRPQEVEEPGDIEEPIGEVESASEEANHGHCVSYWTKQARSQGLDGRFKGAFVSVVAQDEEAVAEKDDPGEGCDFQEELDVALEDQATFEAEREAALAEKQAAKEARKEAKTAASRGPDGGDDENDA